MRSTPKFRQINLLGGGQEGKKNILYVPVDTAPYHKYKFIEKIMSSQSLLDYFAIQ